MIRDPRTFDRTPESADQLKKRGNIVKLQLLAIVFVGWLIIKSLIAGLSMDIALLQVHLVTDAGGLFCGLCLAYTRSGWLTYYWPNSKLFDKAFQKALTKIESTKNRDKLRAYTAHPNFTSRYPTRAEVTALEALRKEEVEASEMMDYSNGLVWDDEKEQSKAS